MAGPCNFTVVPATASQAAEILDVKISAIEALCGEDYSSDQIIGWTRLSDLREVERKIVSDPTFVVIEDRVVIGYSQIAIHSGEVLAVYVRPSHARLGVGAAVLAAAEACALDAGRTSLWVDASLTAERFYAARGYAREGSSSFALEGGIELPCVRMTRALRRR